MSAAGWTLVTETLPPIGQVVEVRTPGGDTRPLKFDRMWWLPDGSMYVYFTPTHWRVMQHKGQPS